MSNIEINELEPCKLNIKYTSNNEKSNSKKIEIVSSLKDIKVKGFRKGKAPSNIIGSVYKKEIDQQAKIEMARDAFMEIISEKKIKPIGNPNIISIDLKDDVFSMEFNVFTLPEFELKQYKGFEIPPYHAEKSVEDIAALMLEDLRNQSGDTVPFTNDDFVQLKDSIIVDYNGYIEGDMVEELSAQGELMTIGQSNLFDDNLLGMKLEETREFDVLIKEEDNSKYAGKRVHFVATLKNGTKKHPAALDDSLAKKFGLETISDLINQINLMASKKFQELENQYYYDQINNRLIESHEINVPAWMVGDELQQNLTRMNAQNATDEEKMKISQIIENNIKLSLILEKVRGEEPDSQLTDEEVLNIIKDKFKGYNENVDELINNLINSGQMQMLMSRARDEYTIDFIKRNSTILE